jgi:hypothetical protein
VKTRHTDLTHRHQELEESHRRELKERTEANTRHAADMAKLKKDFADSTERLTLRLAEEHSAAIRELKSETSASAHQNQDRYEALYADHREALQKLAHAEAAVERLQGELSAEMRKLAADAERHASALAAARAEGNSSLETHRTKLMEAHAAEVAGLRTELAAAASRCVVLCSCSRMCALDLVFVRVCARRRVIRTYDACAVLCLCVFVCVCVCVCVCVFVFVCVPASNVSYTILQFSFPVYTSRIIQAG